MRGQVTGPSRRAMGVRQDRELGALGAQLDGPEGLAIPQPPVRDYDMAMKNLSLDHKTILPVLGTPTVGDRVGLGVALTMLLALLRLGRHGSNEQFDTIRKTQTWYANAYDAGENFSCKTVVGLDQKKQYISTGHTFGKWFARFMRGARLRMGVVRRQNEALMSKLVLGVCTEAEKAWVQARSDFRRMEMEDAVCFMLIAFGAGLRGEEVPLVSLEGLLNFWEETREAEEDDRYIMVTLSGRFKGEIDSRWHMVPISDKTQSRIPFRLWMERIMFRRVNCQHRTKGWLFETGTGTRAKFGKYNPMFRTLVSQARITNSRLVPQSIEAEDFSLWRSPRRGAVLETTQRGVDSKVMELINRWRTKEAAKGSVPNLPMWQVYTEVKSTLPTMLEYSRAR